MERIDGGRLLHHLDRDRPVSSSIPPLPGMPSCDNAPPKLVDHGGALV
jgi:hypothetical protein